MLNLQKKENVREQTCLVNLFLYFRLCLSNFFNIKLRPKKKNCLTAKKVLFSKQNKNHKTWNFLFA